MKIYRSLLAADFTIQALLLFPALTLGIYGIPLLLLIPLGAWQLGSALAKGLAWGSRLHLTYFGLAVAYCLGLMAFAGGWVSLSFESRVQEIWESRLIPVFFIIIIPCAAAIKYCKISFDDFERSKQEEALV